MIGWDLNVQRMIDFVERNLEGELGLEAVAKRLGYSGSCCARRFREVTGRNLRSYIRERRLSEAAVKLRDGRRGILDIALESGFASQEAFTRAFAALWGMSPGAWRKSPSPICLTLPRRVWEGSPRDGGEEMGKAGTISISVQSAPERFFVGMFAEGAEDYFGFWRVVAARGFDCPKVEGTLASLTANMQIGGWLSRNGAAGYLYGVEMSAGYEGPIPEGMEGFRIPAGDYAVFHHPPYDFARDDRAVWLALKAAMEAWKPAERGYAWNDDVPMWQRHDAANMGQSWCRAVKKAGL